MNLYQNYKLYELNTNSLIIISLIIYFSNVYPIFSIKKLCEYILDGISCGSLIFFI